MNKKSLSDEQIKKVSGGNATKIATVMMCEKCPYQDLWIGDYVGKAYNCKWCNGENTFIGRNLMEVS